jgi:hypothetical protein
MQNVAMNHSIDLLHDFSQARWKEQEAYLSK